MLHPGLAVTLVEGGELDRVLSVRRDNEAARTGLHVSTIINDMMAMMYPKKYIADGEPGAISDTQRVTLWEFGNAYEDVISESLQRRIRVGWEKPAPRKHGGVWFSPDGWCKRSRTLDEIKATWVSRRDFLDSPKFLSYLYQGLSYAHVWRAVRIRYHILFVVADYKAGSPLPIPISVTVRWPEIDVPREIHDTIQQHADDRGLREIHG